MSAPPAGGGPGARAGVDLPRLIVTGASGFVGRHLLDALKEDYRIFGIARRSQQRSRAPIHPNIAWYQVDIADRRGLEAVFRGIQAMGGADVCLHLAAYYDFTGDEVPEYERTNVAGTRNVFDLCRDIGVPHVVFSSSVAACAFPKPGNTLDESSPADGTHIYARTKRVGERMLAEYADAFHGVIVRFAALFSDWCEYAPLYVFMDTWVTPHWNQRMLGGRGRSAVPYLHVHEAAPFFQALLDRLDELPHGQVLLMSPDGAVSHRELFDEVTLDYFGHRLAPQLMPKPLCGPGIVARDLLGRLAGHRPFERPWMAEMIDLQLAVNARRTRELLEWSPRPRLAVLRRMPFLVENLKMDPAEWNRRNRAAMKRVRVRVNLIIHQILERHEEAIGAEYNRRLTAEESRERFRSYHDLAEHEHEWNHTLVYRQLMNAVRTRERAVFVTYCHDLAERRFEQGFRREELCGALELLTRVIHEKLLDDPEARGLEERIFEHVTMTLRQGLDQVEEVFELREAQRARAAKRSHAVPGRPEPPPAA